MEEIHQIYPNLFLTQSFDASRKWNLEHWMDQSIDDEEDADDGFYPCDFDEEATYNRYNGSWAQDEMGYSDDDIDTIFDGDPDAYWNID